MAGRRSRRLWWIPAVGGLVLLAACGRSGEPVVSSASTLPASTRSKVAVTTPATAAIPPPSPAPVATDPSPPEAAPPTAAPTVTSVPAQLDRAGDAGQAVIVTADGYGATTATLTTWQRAADHRPWQAVGGPWPAQVGWAGIAPPGEKREGDGRTPSGTYGFDFVFGIQPDPGVALPYRRVTGPSIVWDDVSSSPSYNLWVDGGRGEPMYVSPVYDYGAVIAYNAERTPGLGSAIFLHVSTGRPTGGCVSLPVDRLLDVLRWLDPARAPVIVMGVV